MLNVCVLALETMHVHCKANVYEAQRWTPMSVKFKFKWCLSAVMFSTVDNMEIVEIIDGVKNKYHSLLGCCRINRKATDK